MPFVRISLPTGWSDDRLRAISDGIYNAMRETINIPEGDRFHVIDERPVSRLIADPSYLGVDRTDQMVMIDITFVKGRTDEQKQALYSHIAANLATNAAVCKEDILIVLTENTASDWSFGNGEAQMLKTGVKPHWEREVDS